MIIGYIGAFGLIIIGLAILIYKKNMIKMILGLGVLDSGINLLIITIGYKVSGIAPIFTMDSKGVEVFVDPIPQALTLTSIVIGASVTALAAALVIKVKEHYGTIESDKVRRLNG